MLVSIHYFKFCLLSSGNLTTQQETIHTTNILQDSDPLTSYASYLRDIYTSMSHSQTFQHWNHLPECEFIQLAIIDTGEKRREDREEEMVRQTVQGKIKDILVDKKTIDLNNLFPIPPNKPLVVLPPPPRPRILLIEGAPGGGKSTLAFHICHKWAQGDSSWDRFDIVVLVYLRDQAIQDATTLADILPARTSDMSQIVTSRMQRSDGRNVLFIFDGWDEFPSHLQNNSPVSTIIRQPHKLSLHQSTVLITSRPGNLVHIADRRVDILGFTPHQIREYIEKALDGNSTHIQKLVQHLEEHPVIEGYCYVPLHVAMLVHIFLTMKGALPTTLHELFCNLVLCCIVRELETHDPTKKVLPELSSLNDLPDDLKSKLDDLCILAYEGVMQNKVVFYPKDLCDFHLPAYLPSLGILQAVEGLTFNSESCSYNFLHLSVQELLAAYHISHMDSSKQLEVFERMFGGSRFQFVLCYYSGFTKLVNPTIQDFISTYSQQQSNFKHILPLLHCFYEAQDLSLCSLVRSGFTGSVIKINFQLNPVDHLAIGYFITFLLSEPSCDTTYVHLKIKDTIFVFQKFKLLLLELLKKSAERVSSSSAGWSKRLEMELNGMSITVQVAELIISQLKKLSVWSKLVIRNCKLSFDGFLRITGALQKTDCSHLTELQFMDTIMYYNTTEQIGLNFKKFLEMNKSLTHLSRSGESIESHYIFRGLEHNTTLVHLSLSNTGLDHTALLSLTKMLQINKTLTHLDLSKSSICINFLGNCGIFQALQHNTTLVHLNLSNIGLVATEDTAQALTTMLQNNKTLTHLNISENDDFADSGAYCVFQGLQHNYTLVNLNMSYIKLITSEKTAQALSTMLQVNKTLTHLDLSGNNLWSVSVANCVFKGLQQNTAILHLNLRNTRLETAWALSTMLKVNETLTHLDLSENLYFSDNGAYWVSQGLQYNTTLVYLNLSSTEITEEGAEYIAQALKSNRSLQTLNISQNLIDKCIIDSLEVNTMLKILIDNASEVKAIMYYS